MSTKTSKSPTKRGPKTEQEREDEELKKTLGFDMIERLTSRLPGMGPKTMPYGYTSEKEIRQRVIEIMKVPPRKLTEKQMKSVGIDTDAKLKSAYASQKTLTPEQRMERAERWIERLISSARKRDRLMSDQQLSDWRIGRRLVEGDKAKFIGSARNEHTQAQLLVPRLPGQTGVITHVWETRDSRVLTFHPDEPVEPVEAPGVDRQYVALQVREHTKGWLDLERIPSENEELR